MAELDTLVAQGIAHFEAGRLTEAIAVWSEVIAEAPQQAEAYRWRARAYVQDDDIASAEADLNTVIELEPEDAEAYVERAILFRSHYGITLPLGVQEQDGDVYLRRPGATLDACLADLSRAMTLNPALAAAYLHRGIVYYTSGQWERAVADLSQALALQPDHHAAFLWRGLVRYAQALRPPQSAPALPGDTHGPGALAYERRAVIAALADCGRAIALHPDACYRLHRALLWMTLGAWQRARQDCGEILLTQPALSATILQHALEYGARCATALQAPPGQPARAGLAPLEALVAQGTLHLEAGLVGEAIAVWSWVLAWEPRQAAAYRGRARAYEAIRDYEAAEADLSAAIRLRPQDADAYLERARLRDFDRRGEPAQLIADYTQALALDPTCVTAYLQRGIAYRAALQKERALADFSQALALDPDCHEAWYQRAMTRVSLGTQTQTDAPPRPGYVRVRGGHYHDRGVLEEAIADFSRAIALDPQYWYRDCRARTWMTMGEWQLALRDFETLLTGPHAGVSAVYLDGAMHGIIACAKALRKAADGAA
jgi:tetratricopeptide (TPR) repeat protein